MTATPHDIPSDTALLSAFIQGGDEAPLAVLVARLTPRLYRVARALTAWRRLGAQTVVEQSWRTVLAAAEPLLRGDERSVATRLMQEVTRRSLAIGDSPRDDADADADPARQAAMRAVALLPVQERAVYVLHDVGGVPADEIERILARPAALVRAELWHARLAVITLLGSAVAPTLPEGADSAAPVAAGLWDEPTPPELLERVREAAVHRRALLASRPDSPIRRRL